MNTNRATQEQIDKAVKDATELGKTLIRKGKRGLWWLLIFPDKEEQNKLLSPHQSLKRRLGEAYDRLDGQGQKDLIAAASKMMIEQGPSNGILAVISDAYMAQIDMEDCPTPETAQSKMDQLYEKYGGSMANWPEEFRSESLLVSINAQGYKSVTAAYPYTRKEDGTLHFEENIVTRFDKEPKDKKPDSMESLGRFHQDNRDLTELN